MRRINLDALPLDGIEGLFEFRFAAAIARLADEQQNFSAAAETASSMRAWLPDSDLRFFTAARIWSSSRVKSCNQRTRLS